MPDIRDRLDVSTRDKLLFKLRKLNTEASESLYQFEELGYLSESRDILYYLVRDSKETLDYVQRVLSSMKEGNNMTLRDKIREAINTVNPSEKTRLSQLITSGKVNDDTTVVINSNAGYNLATGKWYNDKVLEYTQEFGVADTSELPSKLVFVVNNVK